METGTGWLFEDWYKEWEKLSKRDYHNFTPIPLDYTEVRDKIVEDAIGLSHYNQHPSGRTS